MDYRCKLFWFIILYLCIDVHRYFAVLVSGEILDSFRIDGSIYEICYICVPELMGCNMEIQRIDHIAVVGCLLSEDRLGELGNARRFHSPCSGFMEDNIALMCGAVFLFILCLRSVYKELHADRETGC